MTEFSCFSRNRSTCVEQLDDQTLKASCRLQDTLTEVYVEIEVCLPDLEITRVNGEVIRTTEDKCLDPTKALQKVLGIRIGAGMLKIIRGLLSENAAYGQIRFMLEECCYGVILAFTKDTLRFNTDDQAWEEKYFQEMARDNPRMYDRCAAFAPGSSLVEGIKPPPE